MDINSIYVTHGRFLVESLQRLGVRPSNVEDVLQEVLVTLHQRLGTYDTSRPLVPWLFGICRNVALAHLRRAYLRREVYETPPESEETAATPEQAALAREQNEELTALLDQLDVDKRAVFVMFEIEEMPCTEIAEMLGIPVGTVYSRLYKAREAMKSAVQRREMHQVWRVA